MAARTPPLTDRQATILRLLRAGLTPREIAAAQGTTTQYVYQVRDRLRELGAIREGER